MGKNTVMIIGGGASGLVASIVAARNGAKVTIIERMNKLGKKILATGNGKCNYTNINMNKQAFHGEEPSFATAVIKSFDEKHTIDFFKELGIYPRIFREEYRY